MKATLEFSLPDEKWDFTLANEAYTMYSVITDLDQGFRTNLKHGIDKERFPTAESVMEYVRGEFCEVLNRLEG